MKLVIDISENYYEILKYDVEHGNDYKPIVLIANGTPLPKGHGDLIDRNEVIKSLFDYFNGKTIGQCIDNTPTIIEADNESEAAAL